MYLFVFISEDICFSKTCRVINYETIFLCGNDIRGLFKMSRRSEGNLFVGRLNKNTRTRDLEDIFEPYGRMIRCDIKYGT